MSNYVILKESVDSNIRTNGNQEITGSILNGVLNAIVDTLGDGYRYHGIVSPSSDAITTDNKIFVFAVSEGTYTNYGGFFNNVGELSLLYYDTAWHKQTICYGLTYEDYEKLQELPLGSEIDENFSEIFSQLSLKANKDGYYSQMGVGVADNLVGRGEAVPALFSRRTTGGSASVEDGVATIKRIKGNSVVWNQLVDPSRIGVSGTDNGITYTYDGKYITLNGTASAVSISDAALGIYAPALVYGHKYYFGYVGDSSMYIQYYAVSAEEGANKSIGSTSGIATMNFHPIGICRFRVRVASGKVCSNVRIPFEIFDLTMMFGAGNEPASVEEFKALFPNDYYAYNAGELISFKGEAIKTDGFNQFDGTKARVFGGKAYYINGTYTTLKFAKAIDSEQTDITPSNHLYTPAEDGYIFATGVSDDFCINISHSGYRNGEYEEHWESERNLPGLSNFDVQYTRAAGGRGVETGLKSALAAHDEQTATKDIRRIGVIDLGTLTYTYGDGKFKSTTVLPNVKEPSSSVTPNAVCKLYVSRNYDDLLQTDKSFNIIFPTSAQHGRIWINDSSYTDATAFKAAMAGVLLFYELATPIETDIAEPRNLQYRVSDFGTETILPQGTDELGLPYVPISADIIYGLNAVDTLRNLPRNYISEQSLLNFIGALADAGIIFNCNMNFNPNTNSYDFEIIPA